MPASRSVTVAQGVADQLAAIFGAAVTVRRLWVPAFAPVDSRDKPILAVRPAGRAYTRIGKRIGMRDASIDIGVVRKLPAPAASGTDPNNDLEYLDACDLLTEQVFDLFAPVEDPDLQAEGDLQGLLSTLPIAGHYPQDITQPTAVDIPHLHESREFVTVITVTYRLMD